MDASSQESLRVVLLIALMVVLVQNTPSTVVRFPVWPCINP
jgi:hypothetical protein